MISSPKSTPAPGDVVTAHLTGLVTGTQYIVQVTAVDARGEESGCSLLATGAAKPDVDTTRPSGTLTINGGAAYAPWTAATLGLSATDNVGVTGYYLATIATPPAATAPAWVAVAATPGYSNSNVPYTLSGGDGPKTVYAWFKDAAGNVSASASATILLDQTAPTNGSLTATAGNAQTALTWSGFADSGSGLATTNTYRLVFATGTTPPATCASGTQIYQGTGTSYTHTGLINGTSYAYRVCATDKAGNVSTGASATATPAGTDTSSPTGTLTINGGAATTNTAAVTLTLRATDNVGVTGYYLSSSATPPAATASGWMAVPGALSYSSGVPYTLSSGNGSKTVYAWYKDAAGNVSSTASASILLGQTPPSNGTLTASPLTLDVSVFTDSDTGAATISSPAFTTRAGNELLLAFVAVSSADGSLPNNSISGVSGGGLTWTLLRRTNAQAGSTEIWRAFAPGLLTNATVTASLAQSGVAASLTLVSVAGVNTTTPVGAVGGGSAATGAPTASLTTQGTNSWVFAVGNDYDGAVSHTPGTNQSMVHQFLSTATQDTLWVQRQNATVQPAGTLVTLNDTAPTNHRWNLSVVEVLPRPGL